MLTHSFSPAQEILERPIVLCPVAGCAGWGDIRRTVSQVIFNAVDPSCWAAPTVGAMRSKETNTQIVCESELVAPGFSHLAILTETISFSEMSLGDELQEDWGTPILQRNNSAHPTQESRHGHRVLGEVAGCATRHHIALYVTQSVIGSVDAGTEVFTIQTFPTDWSGLGATVVTRETEDLCRLSKRDIKHDASFASVLPIAVIDVVSRGLPVRTPRVVDMKTTTTQSFTSSESAPSHGVLTTTDTFTTIAIPPINRIRIRYPFQNSETSKDRSNWDKGRANAPTTDRRTGTQSARVHRCFFATITQAPKSGLSPAGFLSPQNWFQHGEIAKLVSHDRRHSETTTAPSLRKIPTSDPMLSATVTLTETKRGGDAFFPPKLGHYNQSTNPLCNKRVGAIVREESLEYPFEVYFHSVVEYNPLARLVQPHGTVTGDGLYGGGGSIKGRGFFMFMCDLILGKPYMAKTTMWDTVECPKGHDSVFAEQGRTSVANDEHVIFDAHQQYIRYIVEGTVG